MCILSTFFISLCLLLSSYQCNECKQYILGTDGCVIRQLPIPTQVAYPVDARYATESVKSQLSKSFSSTLEHLAVIYGNGDMVAKMYYEFMGIAHENAELKYYGHRKELHRKLCDFEDFYGTYGLTGDDLRKLLDSTL